MNSFDTFVCQTSARETPFYHTLSHPLCATYVLASGQSVKMKVVLCCVLFDADACFII